jgi:2'-5' RNA ligase
VTRATRRLFFALWPSDAIRAALTDACRPALHACAGRVVPARHYHVTLAFLGNQPAHQVEQLATMAAVTSPEFELVLDRFGHWLGSHVLWIGPHQCPAGLATLVMQIRVALDELGVSFDSHDFKAHLTLARKVRALPELEGPTPVHWPVSSFVLVESVTTPAGPGYQVVREFT